MPRSSSWNATRVTSSSLLVRSILVCAVALIWSVPNSLQAGVLRNWNNGAGDNDWFNSLNWSPDGGPDSDDRLEVASGTPATLSRVDVTDNGSIVFSNDGTTLSLGSMWVGTDSEGILKITSGANLSSGDSRVGHNANGFGDATVSGTGSTWTGASNFHIGSFGTGSLLVSGGGHVINNAPLTATSIAVGWNNTGVGEATIQGVGSLWDINVAELSVGYNGSGTLHIRDGAEVESDGGSVGRFVGSSGIVHADGSGTLWDVKGEQVVGDAGTGQVTLSGGAAATSNGLTVGAQAGSIGVVDITGGADWYLPGFLDAFVIGDAGEGEMHVTNGGFAHTFFFPFGGLQGMVKIGSSATGVGVVEVDGTGSLLFAGGSMIVGGQGTGDLLITDGGEVITGTVTIGDTNTGLNSIQVSGGSILDSSEPGTFSASTVTIGRQGNGSMTVSAGFAGEPATATVSNIFVGREATGTGSLNVAGTMDVTGTLDIGSVGTGSVFVHSGGFLDVGTTIVGVNGTLSVTDSTLRTTNLDNTAGGTFSLAGEIEIDGGLADFGAASFAYGETSRNPHWKISNGGETQYQFSWVVGDDPGQSGTTTVEGVSGGVRSMLRATGGGGGADTAIGRDGDGTLNVLDGALVESGDDLFVGRNTGATGVATVRGVMDGFRATIDVTRNDSTNNNVYVGGGQASTAGGVGDLFIEDGGLVVTSGDATFGDLGGSDGGVTVGGMMGGFDATLDAADDIHFGGSDTGVGGIGRGIVNDGGQLDAGDLIKVWDQGVLTLNGGTVNATTLAVVAAGTLNINGGSVNVTNFTAATAFGFDDGTLNVDGGTFTPTANLSLGGTGNPTVNLQNGATGNMAGILTVGASNATFNIDGGSVLTGGTNGIIGSSSDSVGTVNVTGAGSQWSLFDDLKVGESGNGQLNISDGGAVDALNFQIGVSSGSDGIVNVDGAGSRLSLVEDASIGINGTAKLTITDNATVTSPSSTVIGEDGTLELDGGTLETNGLINNGSFAFKSGTLNLLAGSFTDAGGLTIPATGTVTGMGNVNTTISGLPGSTITPTSSMSLGDGASFLGFLHQGTLDVNSQTVTLNSASFAHLGVLTTLSDGTLNAANGVVLGIGDNLVGSGNINAKVAAGFGSTIVASGGNLTLGNAASPVGFASDGELHVHDNSVTLEDANEAALGALTTLGNGGLPGTLVAANGAVVDFGDNITGFGTVNTLDNPATPLVNNGSIAGDSAIELITLSGYVKGVGTLDNVVITGTDAPGFSPAAVNRGSVSYNGTLEIEIGGITPGSGYDQLNHILGDGIADLGGTLDVQLIGGFMPTSGDTFDIITATMVENMFDVKTLPALAGGVGWIVDYESDRVSLIVSLPGDGNLDGWVDGLDYLLWAGNFGDNPADDPPGAPGNGDYNDDGKVDGLDYLVWAGNFGGHVVTSVPEPGAISLLMFGCAAVAMSRRRDRKRMGDRREPAT